MQCLPVETPTKIWLRLLSPDLLLITCGSEGHTVTWDLCEESTNFLSHLHLWLHDLTRHVSDGRSYNTGRLSLHFPVLVCLLHTSHLGF